jgi:hypothetical protein
MVLMVEPDDFVAWNGDDEPRTVFDVARNELVLCIAGRRPLGVDALGGKRGISMLGSARMFSCRAAFPQDWPGISFAEDWRCGAKLAG